MSLRSKLYPPCFISEVCKTNDNLARNSVSYFCDTLQLENKQKIQLWRKKRGEKKFRTLHTTRPQCVKSDFSSAACSQRVNSI